MCDYTVTGEDSKKGKDSSETGRVWIVPPPKDSSVLEQDTDDVRAYSTDIKELYRALYNIYWDRRYAEGSLEGFLRSTQAVQQLFWSIPLEAIMKGEKEVEKHLVMANERYANLFETFNGQFCLVWKKNQKKGEGES
jgi:hypothetical protein